MISDLNNYSPPNPKAATNTAVAIIAVIALLLILSWMDERYRQNFEGKIKPEATQCEPDRI